VSVIDSNTSKLVENVVVGTEPVALLFNPSNNNMYTANVVSNSISVIDSRNNTVAAVIGVKGLPIALEFNPFNDGVYVAGTLTGTEGLVSVIG
jgi:YVTN family beta-propeller protein